MAILFFESFNVQNTDQSIYLDPLYWSKPFNVNYPETSYLRNSNNINVIENGTHGSLKISGYRLDSSPLQQPTPLQLSGISELDTSSKIYLSFRINGLAHNDKYNNTFPYAYKLLTLCNGDSESLRFDIVRTSGTTIQGGTAQWLYADIGLGISIKQSGNEIGLFDLRIGDIPSYGILDTANYAGGYRRGVYAPNALVRNTGYNYYYNRAYTRFTHLEFEIDKISNTVKIKVEGFDVYNKLTGPSYNYAASGANIDNINNLKFYNRGISANGSISTYYPNDSDDADYSIWNGLNNGAIGLDDLVICNNSGYAPNNWVGPKSRIYHLTRAAGYFATMTNIEGWTRIGGYGAIDSRDGDTSYLTSDISGSISAVGFGDNLILEQSLFPNYIQNGIGGIKIFNDVRKTYLDSDFINIYGTGSVSDSGSYINIGSQYTVSKTIYDLQNSFIFYNPETNIPWTSGTFFAQNPYPYYPGHYYTSGSFGVKKL